MLDCHSRLNFKDDTEIVNCTIYIIVPASNFELWNETIVLQSSESVEWRAQIHFTSRLWLTAESNFMLYKLIDVKSAILLKEKDITQNNLALIDLHVLKCYVETFTFLSIISFLFKMLIILKIIWNCNSILECISYKMNSVTFI